MQNDDTAGGKPGRASPRQAGDAPVKGWQRTRLRWIELRLWFLGEVRRSDVIKNFRVNEITASRDLAEYRESCPGNISPSPDGKSYVRGNGFAPTFTFTARDVLETLTTGAVFDANAPAGPAVTALLPPQLHEPDLNVVSAVTEGIHRARVIKIDYCSPMSGNSTRHIVPYVVVNDGVRWHVRGYDRKRDAFRDFVLTRIERAQLTEETPQPSETSEHDLQWMRVVELHLVPKPGLKNPRAICLEYGMTEGVLKLRVRAALAGYVLRRMNVDCSSEGDLSGPEYHLWLRNSPSLVDVANLGIAPGYVTPEPTAPT